ncbi:hypothetical protein O1611_g8200 [Lasiodiplodia mahajangana]|uniref:Uncharacterized protein n=1 Tax=Lasiodiplodia mahajangana TaxID=1108764 RepID=A0ACC2JDI6_9PEZI|nr:hypothetical protein O1611_g8200 [Lasiodiplodia mahajangana]
MSNSISIVTACFPSADASFGPVLHGDDRGVECLATSLRLGHLSKSPSVVAGNRFRLAKAAINVLFTVVQLSLVVAWASKSRLLGHVRTVSLAASVVSFLAGSLMTGLSYAEHARSRRPSFVLNAYLLASLLLDVAIVRSFWLSGLSSTICSIFSASLALKAPLLVMEAVEKGRFLVHPNSDDRNPELTSGLYSRGLIWWMNPLLLDGFRRLLRPDDLYFLDGSISADILHKAFWKAWDGVNPSTKHRLILSCLRALKWPLVKTIVPRLFLLASTISQPLALQRFLSFLLDPSQSISVGYGLIGAYGLIYIGIALSSAFYERQNSRTLTMLRGVLLRLLDLEERAPVYTQFLETLSGLVTIRAFGWSASAIATNHSLVDKSQRPFYLLLMVQQWLTLVLNLVTAALAVLVVGLAVKFRESVSASLTGVSLVQLITLAETLKLLIQFWTSLETSLGGVARIKNFSEETPDENLPGEDQAPPHNWPAHGRIELRDVSSSYDANEERKALSNMDLKIEAGQKVGVVGRTGRHATSRTLNSGKSTFLLTLLRLVPKSSGTILVDGLDISTLDRDSLRSHIITVSQDTFYPPGSVRLNIDPYDSASSGAIEAVLRRVGLWDVVVERGGLEAKFEDDTLSHGQRQLFSLARAVLREAQSRVIVFDEATSSVDAHTDAVIRDFLRDEFREHTVIWIAHRLETIMDFDRVVVLDGGRVVEDGNPAQLSVVRNTRFGQLWNARHRLTWPASPGAVPVVYN